MTGVERLWTQTIQVYILLCVTLEKGIPLFCILISKLAKEDLEVCTEGPDRQESRPLSEDSQVSKQAGSGQGRGRGHGDTARRRRKAKEPKAPRKQKGEDRASCLSEGDYSLPRASTGSQDNLVAGKLQPVPTPPTSPLKSSSASKEGGRNKFCVPVMDLSIPRKFQFN